MRVLYISGRRSRERDALKSIQDMCIQEVNLHIRSSVIAYPLRLLKSIFMLFSFRPEMILLEAAGLFSFFTAFIAKLLKIPFIVRFKGDLWTEYDERRQIKSLKEQIIKVINYAASSWILRNSTAIFPIADHFHSMIREKLDSEKLLYTVPISITGKKDMGCKNDMIIKSKKFILTVTNFAYWKKVEPLITAIKKFSKLLIRYDLEWIILGDGLFLDEFVSRIHEEIKEKMVIIGRWQDPCMYYKKAIALFYISGMEGLPNVLLEASMLILPVVINKDCPVSYFVNDGHTGLVVDLDDNQSIERAFKMVLYDMERMNTMAINAQRYVSDKYSVEHVSDKLRSALLMVQQRLAKNR